MMLLLLLLLLLMLMLMPRPHPPRALPDSAACLLLAGAQRRALGAAQA